MANKKKDVIFSDAKIKTGSKKAASKKPAVKKAIVKKPGSKKSAVTKSVKSVHALSQSPVTKKKRQPKSVVTTSVQKKVDTSTPVNTWAIPLSQGYDEWSLVQNYSPDRELYSEHKMFGITDVAEELVRHPWWARVLNWLCK